MNHDTNKLTRTFRTLRLALAVASATTLGACEDVPPAPRARPPVTETQPPPTPPPATPPPPTTPELKADTKTEAKADTKTEATIATTEDETKPALSLTAARKLLDGGEGPKALALARLAVETSPKRSAAWNVLGRAELRTGKRKGAIESFRKAIELNPRNAFAQNNLGLALIYDKQYEEAADVLEEAVELEPVTSYMWNNLGMAYEQLDRLDEAREAYDKAAAMENDHARQSLARLKGVESVIRTAKAEPEPKAAPGVVEAPSAGPTKEKEIPTATP